MANEESQELFVKILVFEGQNLHFFLVIQVKKFSF